MSLETPSIHTDHDPRKGKFEELLKKYNVLGTIASGQRLEEIQQNLRIFEDEMRPGETVAVFNYGSNSPESLSNQFKNKDKVNNQFGFGAKLSLKDTTIGFGSISGSRKCPAGTILPNRPGCEISGWVGFFTKEQFQAIAKRESGSGMAKKVGSGRYRRSLIYIADPRDREGKKELQAVTFVLDNSGKNINPQMNQDIAEFPPKEESEIVSFVKKASERAGSERTQIRRDLLREMPLKMNEYLAEVKKQRLAATENHRKHFGTDQPITAHWNSKRFRDLRR